MEQAAREAAPNSQSSGAASSLESMIAALRAEPCQDLQEFQPRAGTKLDAVQRVVRSAIEPMEHRQQAIEGRSGTHETAISEMRQQLADIKHSQRGTQTAVAKVKRDIALAEAQAPVSPPPQAGWDRAPACTKVRGTSRAEIALAQLEEASRPMLESGEFAERDITIEAPLGVRVSSKWTIQRMGEARRATRRADNFLEQLRGPGGWRDVTAQRPCGSTERIFLIQDTTLRTVRWEIQTKKVKDILARLYPQQVFYP